MYLVRYYNIFTHENGAYNLFFKIVFMFSAVAIVFMMRVRKPLQITYDVSARDGFPHLILLTVAGVLTYYSNLSLTSHHFRTYYLIALSYSYWLEALAFIPQIVMLHKVHDINNLTSQYVALIGLYRVFYILNW